MPAYFPDDTELLRAEIAAAAARLIAEDGVDYASAKRKAAKQILGNSKIRGDVLPDNTMVEDEVRAYNALFFADTQPVRLRHLRQLALDLMSELTAFQPYLTGAVLNGTAGEHSDIHIQLFVDNTKEVAIYLLNKGVDFEFSESSHFNGRDEVEALSFLWHNEGVHLALYDADDLRISSRKAGSRVDRAPLAAVQALLDTPDNSTSSVLHE